MSRILICANTLSGKTSFMYGMFYQMMKGVYGFTLTPKTHFAQFNSQCKRMGDTSLPLGERFPAPSDSMETYTFLLKYHLKTIDEIQWIDYPGNLLEEDEANPDNQKLMEYLDGADCLFLCIDGNHFRHDTKEEIVEAIHRDGGGMELNFLLNRAAADGKTGRDRALPPVCLIVTKYDLVPPEKREEAFATEILKTAFPVLFDAAAGEKGRLVSICPVTLGKEISQGGGLEPKNMEKPFCYLTFLRQSEQLNQCRTRLGQLRDLSARQQSEPSEQAGQPIRQPLLRITKRLFPKVFEQVTEEQLGQIEETYRQMEQDWEQMRNSLENMALFCNGQRISWNALTEQQGQAEQEPGEMPGV